MSLRAGRPSEAIERPRRTESRPAYALLSRALGLGLSFVKCAKAAGDQPPSPNVPSQSRLNADALGVARNRPFLCWRQRQDTRPQRSRQHQRQCMRPHRSRRHWRHRTSVIFSPSLLIALLERGTMGAADAGLRAPASSNPASPIATRILCISLSLRWSYNTISARGPHGKRPNAGRSERQQAVGAATAASASQSNTKLEGMRAEIGRRVQVGASATSSRGWIFGADSRLRSAECQRTVFADRTRLQRATFLAVARWARSICRRNAEMKNAAAPDSVASFR